MPPPSTPSDPEPAAVDLVIRGGHIVPMDGPPEDPLGAVRTADLHVSGDSLVAILPPDSPAPTGAAELDATGLLVLPGFVQGHVHPCQTLFRGLADDLPLLSWLRQRIWPMEAAHDEHSTCISAQLTVHELLRGGTTVVMGMDSIRFAEVTAEVFGASPITGILGNCIMDVADGTPQGWVPDTRTAVRITERVHREVERHGNLRFAVSPRFVLSLTEGLARDMADYARQHGLRVHTHADEHPDEVAAVRERFGRDYLQALFDQGWLGPHAGVAHCVHTTPDERRLLADTRTAVLHCPGANLKLGSGIAPIADYFRRGIRMALGADGAACNNRLSALRELRAAALLQAMHAGPGAWPAAQALRTLTLGGAEALGLADRHGSITTDKCADFVCMDLGAATAGSHRPAQTPPEDLVSSLVYAADDACVRHVVARGRLAVRDGAVQVAGLPNDGWTGGPADRPLGQAVATARTALLVRAGLAR